MLALSRVRNSIRVFLLLMLVTASHHFLTGDANTTIPSVNENTGKNALLQMNGKNITTDTGSQEVPTIDHDIPSAGASIGAQDGSSEEAGPKDPNLVLNCDKGSCKTMCDKNDLFPFPDFGGPTNPQTTRRKKRSAEDTCSCDKYCIIFGDCCFDYFSYCLDANLTSLLSDVQTVDDIIPMMTSLLGDEPGMLEQIVMFLHKSCQMVHNENRKSYFWMISDCSQSNDDSSRDEISKCVDPPSDPLGLVPASLIQQPAIVFRNVHCALCNGIDMTNLQLWKSEAECSEDTSIRSYQEILASLESNACIIKSTNPPEARKCIGDIDSSIDSCPLVEDGEKRLRNHSLHCRSYSNPVSSDFGELTNWHCGSCSVKNVFQNTTYQCRTDHEQKYFPFYDVSVPVCQGRSCDRFCHKYSMRDMCQCDAECLLFGDCCYDFVTVCLKDEYTLLEISGNETLIRTMLDQQNVNFTQNKNKNDTVTVDDRQSKENDSSIKPDFENDDTEIADKETINDLMMMYHSHKTCISAAGSEIWVVGSCPGNKSDPQCSDVLETTNTSLITPASLKSYPRLVFRNIYCGLCHGFPMESLQQWGTFIYCRLPVTSFQSVEQLLSDGTCVVRVSEMKGGRQCSRRDFEPTGKSADPLLSPMLCKAYRYPVNANNEFLRNPHCSRSLKQPFICDDSAAAMKPEDNRAGQEFNHKGGLGILFNFKGNDVNFFSTDGQPISRCQINEVYDHFNSICRKLECQQGKIAVNGSCIKNGTWYASQRNMLFPNGTMYLTLASYIRTQDVLDTSDIEQVFQGALSNDDIEEYASLLEFVSLRVTNASVLPGYLSKRAKRETVNGFLQLVQVRFKRTDSIGNHLNAFSQLVRIMPSITPESVKFIDIIVQNFRAEDQMVCSYGAVKQIISPSIDEVNGKLYANDSDRLYPLDNIAFVYSVVNSDPVLHEVFVCDIPLDCDPVVYNLTDFTLEDGSLKSLHSDLVLTNDSYFVSGEEIFSCHNFTHSPTRNLTVQFFKFDHVQDILTYVTSGLSLVSLVVTLLVYILLPKLRNLPGRLTMSLSVSLLLAQGLLLLIHLPSGVLCQALAIAIHFFWLTSFMWMMAMSINLARTFTSKMNGASASSIAGSHAWYAALTVVLPLVIVTATAVVDFLNIPGLEIGYGAYGVCWIANPWASLLVFGAPLATIIIFNFIAFIVTFYHIERSLRASKDISSTRGNRNKAIIYGKLFVIMGLSWSFSFAAAFADVPALWYIFIILNGLQGFYIFLSFICTDRVMRLLKKKISGQDMDESTSTKNTSMSKI